jgi:hypothetical protein
MLQRAICASRASRKHSARIAPGKDHQLGQGIAMENNQIRKVLLSGLAIIGVGVSASAFAAGSGSSGSTGGFVQPLRQRDAVAAETLAASGPVAQIQEPSGRGAHNPIDDEGHRVNRTWVDNESTQLASGLGARNYVERDSDRFDAFPTEQTTVAHQAEHRD